MTPGERFQRWINGLAVSWRDTVKSWGAGLLGKGIEIFADILARSYSEKMQDLITGIEGVGELPPGLQPLLAEAKSPTGEAGASILTGMGTRAMSGLTGTFLETVLRPWRYRLNRLQPTEQLDSSIALGGWLRGLIDEEALTYILSSFGFASWQQDKLKRMTRVLLPSDLVLPAWLRDRAKYQPFVDDLTKLGLDANAVELLTEMAYRVPGVQDIIRYVVKEAYNPEIVAEFGQAAEYPQVAEADAEKSGVRPDMLMKEWISHWTLPGVSQGFDMLHRGLITPERLQLLLKALDIMPGWRDKLTALSWNIPGRIELRMLARYGLVDKAFLVDALRKDGLAEEYRDVVADMNLVLGLRTDLQARYSKGWITAAEVQAELEASGLGEGIRTRVYQYIVKNASALRTAAQKDLTLAQIEKGVRKDKLTRAQAVDLIIDLGYDAQEARFLLEIDVPEDGTDARVRARELTKAEILSGLKYGTMTEATARARLITLRYTAEDARFIIATYNATIPPMPPPDIKEITTADILGGLKTGILTSAQARERLLVLKYRPVDADYVLALYQASIKPPPTVEEKEATATDITKAVKLGFITPRQGYDMFLALDYSADAARFILTAQLFPPKAPLTEEQKAAAQANIVLAIKQGLITPEQGYTLVIALGYTAAESQFILSIPVEMSPFSPVNFDEFKGLTHTWRQSQGLPIEDTTKEIQAMRLDAAQAVVEGKVPILEQQRLAIDTIRRKRRAGLINRQQEIDQLTALKVPADYVGAIVDNDDTRLAAKQAQSTK